LKPEVRNFFRYYLPALLWTGFVFAASFDAFSAEHTGVILHMIVNAVYGPMDPGNFEVLHTAIRKTAHITEYGILALLWLRAFQRGFALWHALWVRRALAVCIAVAATDEFHQSFVPSRGSALTDVILDTAGASLFLMLAWIVHNLMKTGEPRATANPTR
jgi:VanZ family protein